jgi:tetratricopeptide (TPR) repeat protein
MAALHDVHSLSDSAQLFTLEWMHLQQLEAQGDIEAALAVLKEDLNTGTDHVRVVQFLEQHGRMRDAFAHAEAALKAFPDDWQVQDCVLRAYERDGWTVEAFDLRMRRFRARPAPETYLAVLAAAGHAGHDVVKTRETILSAIAEQEIALAQSRAQRTGHTRFGPQRFLGPGPGERDVSLRASLLCAENHWGEALQLVQLPAYCSEQLLEHIALHLGNPQWDQAVTLLQRVLSSTMLRATSPYRRELDLVRKILARMSDDTTRRHWLSGLVSVHKAKRNFVRDLPVV